MIDRSRHGDDMSVDKEVKKYPTITARIDAEDRKKLEQAAKLYKRSVALITRKTLALAIKRGLVRESMELFLHEDRAAEVKDEQ